MSDYLCWLQPLTASSAEQRAHTRELLALLSAGSTASTWAAKGRGGGGKGEGKRIFAFEWRQILFMLGAEHRELMQPSLCQPLSLSSPQVSRTLLPFNSPLVHLPMSDFVYCRSLSLKGCSLILEFRGEHISALKALVKFECFLVWFMARGSFLTLPDAKPFTLQKMCLQ